MTKCLKLTELLIDIVFFNRGLICSTYTYLYSIQINVSHERRKSPYLDIMETWRGLNIQKKNTNANNGLIIESHIRLCQAQVCY